MPLFVILPAVITAQDSHTSVSGAYLLAARQTHSDRCWACRRQASCAGTPVAGLGGSPPTSPPGSSSTPVFYLLSQWFDALDFTRQDGSVAQVYLMLIASTPLTGRMLLWVLAPSAVVSQKEATT